MILVVLPCHQREKLELQVWNKSRRWPQVLATPSLPLPKLLGYLSSLCPGMWAPQDAVSTLRAETQWLTGFGVILP